MMFTKCPACKGARQITGVGSLNIVDCKTCEGFGKVKKELVDTQPEIVANADINIAPEVLDFLNAPLDKPEANEIIVSKKSVSKSIKEVLTNGKKKK